MKPSLLLVFYFLQSFAIDDRHTEFKTFAFYAYDRQMLKIMTAGTITQTTFTPTPNQK